MTTARYMVQRGLYGLLLLLGVTLLSFLLMVRFGPDKTWELLGKNPTAEQVAEVRSTLGYDRPFLLRYAEFLGDLATFDLGLSDSSGEPVARLIGRTLPVTLALVLPGFVLGNLLGVALGLLAAWRRGDWLDRLITGASVAGMSVSFLVIIIALQILLCTPYGLNWFPARGWRVDSLGDYLYYAAVPTLALVLVTLGYNTRVYRAVRLEELRREHILTVRAFGGGALDILGRHVLRNSLVPVITRVVFSVPLVVVSGSLLLETYFGIPGIGRATYDAITSGDQPVLLAVVSLTAVMFVLAQLAADLLYRLADPRTAAS
ncbi:MAG: ABC transporter permease [Gammaproteobacteria bacterium]